jgi:hypothetical protein
LAQILGQPCEFQVPQQQVQRAPDRPAAAAAAAAAPTSEQLPWPLPQLARCVFQLQRQAESMCVVWLDGAHARCVMVYEGVPIQPTCGCWKLRGLAAGAVCETVCALLLDAARLAVGDKVIK